MFSEFTGLSNAKGAVNLGQGFPTVPLSAFVVDSLMKAAQNGVLTHQYTRSEGHPRLVQGTKLSLAAHLNKLTPT